MSIVVSIPPDLESFIRRELSAGAYRSKDELDREAVHQGKGGDAQVVAPNSNALSSQLPKAFVRRRRVSEHVPAAGMRHGFEQFAVSLFQFEGEFWCLPMKASQPLICSSMVTDVVKSCAADVLWTFVLKPRCPC